jgi:hypothetical protein
MRQRLEISLEKKLKNKTKQSFIQNSLIHAGLLSYNMPFVSERSASRS